MWPSLKKKYIGSHIRTWGFFKDFKDFLAKERFDSSVTTFNIKRVTKAIRSFIRKYKKQLYLSSESIRLKEIIKEILEKQKKVFHSNMVNISHNRASKEVIGLDIVIDIEILGNADALLLSADSSFSKTVFFKNRNCLKSRCFSVATLDRGLYQGYYKKQK